jgi:DNA-binding NtrC family response regulator
VVRESQLRPRRSRHRAAGSLIEGSDVLLAPSARTRKDYGGRSGLSVNIVIVHDEPAFLDRAVAVLRYAGFNVTAFADPIEALNEIEAGQHIDALVTRVTFLPGKPHGVSLALVLRANYPGLKVVFTARTERIEHTEGIGELVPHLVDLEKLVATVARAVEDNVPRR